MRRPRFKAAAVTLRLASSHSLRMLLLAGVAAVAVSGCASNRVAMVSPDFSSQTPTQQATLVSQLAQKYKANPRDKTTLVYYSAALRSAGQANQAASVLEDGIALYPDDVLAVVLPAFRPCTMKLHVPVDSSEAIVGSATVHSSL